VNLLGLAALALPAAVPAAGLPFGVTLIAPGGAEAALVDWGSRWEVAAAPVLGARLLAQAWGEAPAAAARSGRIARAARADGVDVQRVGAELVRDDQHVLRSRLRARGERQRAERSGGGTGLDEVATVHSGVSPGQRIEAR